MTGFVHDDNFTTYIEIIQIYPFYKTDLRRRIVSTLTNLTRKNSLQQCLSECLNLKPILYQKDCIINYSSLRKIFVQKRVINDTILKSLLSRYSFDQQNLKQGKRKLEMHNPGLIRTSTHMMQKIIFKEIVLMGCRAGELFHLFTPLQANYFDGKLNLFFESSSVLVFIFNNRSSRHCQLPRQESSVHLMHVLLFWQQQIQ